MDRNTAWADLQEAVNTAMWGEAILKAEDLLTWLERNGFPPSITGKPVFDRIVARATCEAIAYWSM
jgi:hypothetical protein